MSKTPQDWLDTYYPTPATSPEALAAPAAHSLRKWQGLVPEVLEEYGLYAQGGSVFTKETDDEVLAIHGETCALCELYANTLLDCPDCPISILRQGCLCDCQTPDERKSGREAPYGQFTTYNDPYPMIHLLEKAVEKERGECQTT